MLNCNLPDHFFNLPISNTIDPSLILSLLRSLCHLINLHDPVSSVISPMKPFKNPPRLVFHDLSLKSVIHPTTVQM